MYCLTEGQFPTCRRLPSNGWRLSNQWCATVQIMQETHYGILGKCELECVGISLPTLHREACMRTMGEDITFYYWLWCECTGIQLSWDFPDHLVSMFNLYCYMTKKPILLMQTMQYLHYRSYGAVVTYTVHTPWSLATKYTGHLLANWWVCCFFGPDWRGSADCATAECLVVQAAWFSWKKLAKALYSLTKYEIAAGSH